jgi:hypothetical protein
MGTDRWQSTPSQGINRPIRLGARQPSEKRLASFFTSISSSLAGSKKMGIAPPATAETRAAVSARETARNGLRLEHVHVGMDNHSLGYRLNRTDRSQFVTRPPADGGLSDREGPMLEAEDRWRFQFCRSMGAASVRLRGRAAGRGTPCGGEAAATRKPSGKRVEKLDLFKDCMASGLG